MLILESMLILKSMFILTYVINSLWIYTTTPSPKQNKKKLIFKSVRSFKINSKFTFDM